MIRLAVGAPLNGLPVSRPFRPCPMGNAFHTLLVYALIGFLGFVTLSAGRVQADNLTYQYDELGRLRGVIDATGATGQYDYDAVGNLLRVVRPAGTTPVITEFTPNAGPVGATVRILGTHFDATPTNNTVKFNGTSSIVSAATAAQLTTSVPTGATSGKISVTTAAGMAVSAQAFLVSNDAGVLAPVIDSFTPTSGTAGTRVTLFGKNFDPTPNATVVTLNGHNANIMGTVTSYKLDVEIPKGTSTGPWKIKTTTGEAISATDFIVTPSASDFIPALSGWNSADILRDYRLVIGQAPKPVTIDQAGKAILLTYENLPGSGRSLRISSLATVPAGQNLSYYVFSPSLKQVATGSITPQRWAIHPPTTDEAGWFTVLVRAPALTTASFNVALTPDSALSINTDKTVNLSQAGQEARLTFSGIMGQNLSLAVTNVTLAGTSPTCTLYAYKPDGTIFAGPLSTQGNSWASGLPTLPSTGTYTILVGPLKADSASLTLTLSSDASATLPINGVSRLVNLAVTGQRARLAFGGTLGQNLGLGLFNATQTMTVYVVRPDGTTYSSGCGSTRCDMNLVNLPMTGTYSLVVVSATPIGTRSFNIQLSSDLTDSLALNTDKAISLTRMGQNARLTFSGTTGQNLNLAATNVSLLNQTSSQIYIYKPDGTTFFSAAFNTGQNSVWGLPALPVTGTYTIFIDPLKADSALLTLTLSSDLPGTLPVDGTPQLINLAVTGQRARLTFGGTLGQNLGLGLFNATQTMTVYVVRPDGTTYSSGCGSTRCDMNLVNLPATGTYSLVVVSATPIGTRSFNILLSNDLTGSLALNTANTVSLTRMGQNARLTFSGTAGQNLALAATGVTLTGGNQTSGTEYIYKPDGTTLIQCSSFQTNLNSTCNLPTLASTGSYTVLIDPLKADSASLTLTLSPR